MHSETLYNKDLFPFINSHLNCNVADLLMKYSGKEVKFDLNFAAVQIENRKRARKKIPYFLSNDNFLFPDLISSEQATDERVALFHAALIGKGNRVTDLTAGLGIDAMTMALEGNKVVAVEIDPLKAEILQYNANILDLTDFTVINDDCENYLKQIEINDKEIFFIDPARRDEAKNKTYAFSDCKPDITNFYRHILNNGGTLIVKASPLLDIEAIKKQFTFINHIYVVGVKGECKEVLIELKSDRHDDGITAIDLDDKGIKSTFSVKGIRECKKAPIAEISDLNEGSYLYEPNASVMKLNAGEFICEKYPGLKKLSKNTELFVSNILFNDFPGRIVEIKRNLSSRDLKKLKGKGYSVSVRNYPMKPEQLKRKIGVGESDDMFLYAFRIGEKEKTMIIEGKRMKV